MASATQKIHQIIQKLKYIMIKFRHEKHDSLKDTANLLGIINYSNTNALPENTLLVSFDIANIFSNIDNMPAIKTVKVVLDNNT